MTSKGIDLNLRLYCKDCKDPIPNIVENFAAGDMICGNCGIYFFKDIFLKMIFFYLLIDN